MKKFRDILETVYPPKSGDEKNFMDKHIVDKKDNPNAAPGQFTSDKKKAKRIADYDEGDDEKVYEAAELHTKRADKEAVVVRAVDPKTGQSRARVVNRGAGEIKIGEETDLDEKAVNPYAIGMAAAMKQAGDKPPLKKSTIVKGHEIAKSIKKEAMDPVGKHDADIDNDGDVDKSDKYLIKRRKAIARAVNEAVEVSHDRYMGAHGKKARDTGQSGNWMFTHKSKGDVDYNDEKEVHSTRGKFADAKKSAQQWAKKHGHSSVYVMEEVEQIDELSQDALNNYHAKAGADRLKAKATVQKTMDMKKPAASTVDKATSAFSRFQKRGKGMSAAANKMSEENDLDEETMPGNIGLRMVDSHEKAAAHHKKNGNMKGYAAHLDVADRIKNAVERAGPNMPIRSIQIEKASDKAFSNHPHRVVKSEETDLDEGHGVFLKGGSVGETRSGKPVEVHSNIEDAKAQAKRLNKHLSPGEKKNYGLKYHVKPVAEGFVVVDLDEVSKATLGSYIKKASHDVATKAAATGRYGERANKEADVRKKTGDMSNYRQGREDDKMADNFFTKSWKRREGIAKATDRLTKEEVDQIDEAFKVGAMHLEDGSAITLTREDVDMLNNLFNQLNSSNKSKMEQRLKSSKNGFNEIITFAKEVV